MGEKTRKTTLSNDPQPEDTAGLTDGGSLQAGDTPAGEGSMSGAVGDAPGTPNHGPVSGNRTPAVIGIGFVALITLALIVYGVAEIIGYLRD